MGSKAKPSQDGLGQVQTIHRFPSRPSYGINAFSTGTGPHSLLANYFAIDVSKGSKNMWKRYNLEVQHSNDKNDVPKGFKLQQIIKQAVRSLGIGDDKYASDFKSRLIVLEGTPLKKREVIEHLTNDQGRATPYRVQLVGETDIVFDGPKGLYLKAATVYHGHLQSLYPLRRCSRRLRHRSQPQGSQRSWHRLLEKWTVFRFEPPNDRTDMQEIPGTPMMLIRGYFQSVRSASGSSSPFLLNAMAYGVFRKPEKLGQVIKTRNQFHSLDKYLEYLVGISRQLAKAKIICSAPIPGSRSAKKRNKVILGLADQDRSTGGITHAHPPRFAGGVRFGGPRQVSFFLDGSGNMSGSLQAWYGNTKNHYRSVYDYYGRRESICGSFTPYEGDSEARFDQDEVLGRSVHDKLKDTMYYIGAVEEQ